MSRRVGYGPFTHTGFILLNVNSASGLCACGHFATFIGATTHGFDRCGSCDVTIPDEEAVYRQRFEKTGERE